MKGKVSLKITLVLMLFLTSQSVVFAQISLKETSLKQQIDNSSLVVEGKVISKKSFWNADHSKIFTANTVEVYKVFKGRTVEKIIEVITMGGVVGLRGFHASNSLKLREGDMGVFALYDSNVEASSKSKSQNKQFKAYGALQGFYKYNLKHDIAFNPFNKKQGVKSSFYNEIMSHTKSSYIEVENFNIDVEHSKLNKSNKTLALGITNFAPTTSTAGTDSVLTINGTDFGTTQGKVGFSNADSGGFDMGVEDYVDALDTQVLSWSNTQITVEIPSVAGTGKIRVTHNDTSTIESTTNLTISYAELNGEADIGSGVKANPVQHYDDNGSGGYTWEMQTEFFDDTEHPDAKAAFMRAFESWRCATKVNWEVSGTATTTDVVSAGDEHVIRFDNGSELEFNVLGQCSYSYAGRVCAGEVIWWVTDLDIVFDSQTSWYFGTGAFDSGEIDFETVALHELGHGHQLGHVINTNNVMHYAIGPNESNIALDANSIAAATNVHSRSTGNPVCFGDPLAPTMADYTGTCGLSIEENNFEGNITIFPNPAKNQFYVKNASFANLEKVVVYDINGRQISKHDLSNTSRTQAISLTGISKGIYFVNIHSKTAFITKKLIID